MKKIWNHFQTQPDDIQPSQICMQPKRCHFHLTITFAQLPTTKNLHTYLILKFGSMLYTIQKSFCKILFAMNYGKKTKVKIILLYATVNYVE